MNGISASEGPDYIAPTTRQQLKKDGLTEAEFLAMRRRLKQEARVNEPLEEWNRMLREHFAYEKRKSERQATGR